MACKICCEEPTPLTYCKFLLKHAAVHLLPAQTYDYVVLIVSDQLLSVVLAEEGDSCLNCCLRVCFDRVVKNGW